MNATHLIYRVEHAGQQAHVVCVDGSWRQLQGDLFGQYTPGSLVDPADCRVLAPVVPSKIVAVGLNYRDHAQEMNKPLPDVPLIFLKPSTAVINTGDAIVIPAGAGRVDFEAELAVVIGRRAKAVAACDAMVLMPPGAMQFTITSGASSTARARVKDITAAFEAL